MKEMGVNWKIMRTEGDKQQSKEEKIVDWVHWFELHEFTYHPVEIILGAPPTFIKVPEEYD